MESKEDVREIINHLTKSTGKSQEELALELGYNRTYISEVLTPSGKLTQKFIKAINRYAEDLKVGFSQTKAPDIKNVDAFVATEIIKMEATLAVIVEILAEQEAARMNVPVTKMISAFDKAIQDKEQLMRSQKR